MPASERPPLGDSARAEANRFPRLAPPVGWTCDGVAVAGLSGETLAASLTAIGRMALGNGPKGEPRGMFCGMGVCWDCAVTVDGVPGVRACMTPLREGMAVETRQPPGIRPPGEPARVELLQPDVLVVGGGPAGLSAALAAERAGATVVLVDDRKSLGGQYFKPLAPSHGFAERNDIDAQFRQGMALVDAVKASSIVSFQDTTEWGAWPPLEVAAISEGRGIRIRPKRLILATGAFERAVPMPGWTLPGCMTSGAAQMLIRSNRVAPGTRVVVAGNGPLNLQVAAELFAAKVDVSVVEAATLFSLGRVGALAGMATSDPGLAASGFALLARLRGRVTFGSAVTAIHGAESVEAVTVARLDAGGKAIGGTERRIEADAVCIGSGFWPSNELARALGCRHDPDYRGVLRPVRDGDGRSSVAEVYIAGDFAGLGGAQAAIQEGRIAGHAAAAATGHAVVASARMDESSAALARHRKFQAHLWRAFRAPPLCLQFAEESTEICRCESVTLGQIRAAQRAGAVALGSIKRETRAGMGRCQGRYCSPLLRELATPDDTGELSLFAPRPPARPVPIGLIAADDGE